VDVVGNLGGRAADEFDEGILQLAHKSGDSVRPRGERVNCAQLLFPPPPVLICACNRTASRLSPRKFLRPTRFGILLALLVFAAFPQVILGLETFVARDFGFFAYPLAHFQRDCFWRGELPFWNPYNNCGVPFLAQWNTMPLYPPALFI
jgi:hypothetical protein